MSTVATLGERPIPFSIGPAPPFVSRTTGTRFGFVQYVWGQQILHESRFASSMKLSASTVGSNRQPFSGHVPQ